MDKSSGFPSYNDILTYSYTGVGNQVRAIADAVPDVAGRGDFYDGTDGNLSKEYYYDPNGNMWLNRNKRMKTLYNYLNLPARISDTITPANNIEYVYTSAGEKLKQRLSTGTTQLYLGNFVYTLDGSANGIAVKYILTQEGRATYSAGTYTYEYFMKDHLGNTRVSFNVPSTTAVIVQQSDYYPFGMIHQPQATTTSDNRYLYNGKEFQNNLLGGLNLDLYDYGARMYDPQIGRWHVIDLMIEKHQDYTPFAYTYNNPIRYADLFGLDTLVFDQKGFYYQTIQAKGNSVLMVQGKDGDHIYSFNDPKRDVKSLEKAIKKYGSETQLLFSKTDSDIEKEIESSGANIGINQDDKFKFAFKESLSTGSLDFWSSKLIPEMHNAGIELSDIKDEIAGFYIFSGNNKAYNAMDAGNFLWGGAMQRLGFSPGIPQLVAHIYHHFIGRYMLGSPGIIDSPADQRAITNGYNKLEQLNK